MSATPPITDPDPPSDRWFYGVVGSFGLWIVLGAVLTILGPDGLSNPLMPVVWLAAWVGLPVSVYFDAKYVGATSDDWQPNPTIWGMALALWFVNLVACAYYLYRRKQAMA